MFEIDFNDAKEISGKFVKDVFIYSSDEKKQSEIIDKLSKFIVDYAKKKVDETIMGFTRNATPETMENVVNMIGTQGYITNNKE